MATPRSYAYLAAKWITGYVPSQSDFDDLFSSFENVVDDNLLIGSQSIANAVNPPVQGTAVQITAKMVKVTNTTGGDGGILTQSAVVGSILFIQNLTLANIYVYPKSGEQIIGNVTNAPFVLPSGNALMLFCTVAGEWSALSNAPASLGYLEYMAIIEQSGSAAPTATILNNTLGAVPVWTRNGTGSYQLSLTGAFQAAKTVCFANGDYNSENNPTVSCDATSMAPDAIQVFTLSTIGVQADGNKFSFNIRVYP